MENNGGYKLNTETLQDNLLPFITEEAPKFKITEQRISDLELLVLQLGGVI